MRLSEAILLGATTISLEPGNIDSCALGSAANAVGLPSTSDLIPANPSLSELARYHLIFEEWPWLKNKWGMVDHGWEYYLDIARKFDTQVCTGKMTIDQLSDYVRSIEPNCDCNTFECCCDRITSETADMFAALSKSVDEADFKLAGQTDEPGLPVAEEYTSEQVHD